MSRRHDVVVVGAGMVGGVFACLAARLGVRVALIDAGPPPVCPPAAPTGARVVALSGASRQLLQRCGAWQHLAPERRGSYTTMRVWDADGDPLDHDALVFRSADIDAPNLGYIAENDALVAATWQAAQAYDNLTWHSDCAIESLDIDDEWARVRGSNGSALSARLVVAADGARSACRDLLGIGTDSGSYGQRAVVCHVRGDKGHDGTAWQRFLPDGPLALLPLADGRSSLVWSSSDTCASELLALDEAGFCTALTQASDGVIGTIGEATERLSFPLGWLHARRYCAPRFAMIGDAAHAIHPLAGQGVNLGLLDAASLVQLLHASHDAGRDLGDLRALRRYERWRKSENVVMLRALSGLNRLFASDWPLLVRSRRAGLGLVNRMPPVKNALIMRAMGMAGDLPDL